MRYIALKIPLSAFALSGRGQRHHPRNTRIEILGDPLDRAALARCVTTLEDHDDPGASGLDPFLHLDQFGLQPQ
jgi:hypothetical protein